jgi:hypothetical protein
VVAGTGRPIVLAGSTAAGSAATCGRARYSGDVHQVPSCHWDRPGPALADLADIGGVPVGLLVCSALWLPEVARVLAVRAELLLAPAGGAFGPLDRNWQAGCPPPTTHGRTKSDPDDRVSGQVGELAEAGTGDQLGGQGAAGLDQGG